MDDSHGLSCSSPSTGLRMCLLSGAALEVRLRWGVRIVFAFIKCML